MNGELEALTHSILSGLLTGKEADRQVTQFELKETYLSQRLQDAYDAMNTLLDEGRASTRQDKAAGEWTPITHKELDGMLADVLEPVADSIDGLTDLILLLRSRRVD